jgi:hypothetical protein
MAITNLTPWLPPSPSRLAERGTQEREVCIGDGEQAAVGALRGRSTLRPYAGRPAAIPLSAGRRGGPRG